LEPASSLEECKVEGCFEIDYCFVHHKEELDKIAKMDFA
jgi:hypothetical protein